MIRAIETEYADHRFRSRREARWAVVLDALGIHWEYEPQGYAFDDGTCYLPDFLCRDMLLWIEVKPTLSISPLELHKAELLADGTSCPVCIVGELEDKVLYLSKNRRGKLNGDIWPGFFAEYWGAGLIDEALRRGKQARFEK